MRYSKKTPVTLIVGCWASCLAIASAALGATAYTDEASFLTALANLGHTVVREGFEDDAAWGNARTPQRNAPVTSRGVTWTSNNDTSQLSSSSGAARSGDWGVFSLPHGDFDNLHKNCTLPAQCGDGLVATSPVALVALGGWFATNTPPAELRITIDTTVIDFPGETSQLTTRSRFLGVIEPTGFTRFEAFEVEGTAEDQKFIYADDFAFALLDTPPPKDAGATVDSAVADAAPGGDLGGTADVGSGDAVADAALDDGTTADGATADATKPGSEDGGTLGEGDSDETGCSCSSGDDTPPTTPLMGLLLCLCAFGLCRRYAVSRK